MNNKHNKSLLSSSLFFAIWVVGMCFLPLNSSGQQGWEKVYGGSYSEASTVINSFDGNILVAGVDVGGLTPSQDPKTYIVKMNAYGDRTWQKTYSYSNIVVDILPASNQTYFGIRSEEFSIFGNDYNKPIVFNFDENGELLWESIVDEFSPYSISSKRHVVHPDGSIAFFATADLPTPVTYFTRIDENGTITAYNQIDFTDSDELVANPSGGYYVKSFENFGYLEFTAIDTLGNVVSSETYLEINSGTNPVLLPNGDWYIFQNVAGDVFQIKIEASTNTVSSNLIIPSGAAFQDVTLLSDGFMLSGLDYSQTLNSAYMVRTDFDGNVIWEKRHGHLPGAQFAKKAVVLEDGGFAVAGYFQSLSATSSYVFKTNAAGDIYTNSLAGSVKIDEDDDCENDFGEPAIEDWVVAAQKGDQVFVSLTNEYGDYILPLDTGSYQINVYPVSDVWDPCFNEVDLFLATENIDTLLDFPIQKLVDCPVINVSNIVPILVPCENRPGYVFYCNNGTDTAFNAYIDIAYDSLITPVSSSLPFISLANNTYRFDLGNLAPLECGDFDVNLSLSCDAVEGASYCIETHAYPDSICLPDTSGWSGAFLEASGFCEGNNVFLRLQNVGDNDMNDYANYIVIEDILYIELDSVDLNEGEIFDIPLPANGSTYTLIAEQVNGAPGFSNPIAIVEGCGVDVAGDFSIGFTNQFPLDDVNPFLDYDCPTASTFGTTNGLVVAPTGYSNGNIINSNTNVEYLIHFQNKGMDSVNTVVVRDTLDEYFDIASFKAGASSHQYDVEMEGERILKFTFQNINLPNANVDELNSFGFVEFKIAPIANTASGTIIKNHAGIYFDLAEPVLTEEIFHTIGDVVVEIISTYTFHPEQKNIEVNIFPNPFINEARIEVLNHDTNRYLLEIFNLQGQLIRHENLASEELVFEKKNLSVGVYFYRLTAEDGFKHSGQIQVH